MEEESNASYDRLSVEKKGEEREGEAVLIKIAGESDRQKHRINFDDGNGGGCSGVYHHHHHHHHHHTNERSQPSMNRPPSLISRIVANGAIDVVSTVKQGRVESKRNLVEVL